MEGVLSYMKLARYDQYKPEDTARAESALLAPSKSEPEV